MEAYLRHKELPVCAWGKLYAAGLFRKIRYPEGRIYEDCAVFHLLVHSANRIAYTQKSAYVYRKRPGSITASPFSASNLDILYFCPDLAAFIQENYPDLLPCAYANLLSTCSGLMRKIARSGQAFPDIEHQLQLHCRKHWWLYLRHGYSFKSKAFVLLVCISPKLAKYAARLYSKAFKA